LAVTKKGILNKLYIVFIIITLFLIAIVVRLTDIQFTDGEKYRELSQQLTLRNDTIFANKGSVFSDDGSLLATSMSRYEIRMDAFTVEEEVFEKNIRALSEKLAKKFGKSASNWEVKLEKPEILKTDIYLLLKDLGITIICW